MHFYSREQVDSIKCAALDWARSKDPVFLLDSKQQNFDPYGKYEWLFAAGSRRSLRVKADSQKDPFDELKQLRRSCDGWLFGYLSYELKNSIEKLSSNNPAYHKFADLMFFEPEYLLLCTRNENTYSILAVGHASEMLLKRLERKPKAERSISPVKSIPDLKIMSWDEYREAFDQIRAYIQRGDIYEANYCFAPNAESPDFDPYAAVRSLGVISPMPYSTFVKDDSEYLISASPERFLVKHGKRIYSQPMKGTISRSEDPEQDSINRYRLAESEKERSENIMICDIVRNDLGRSARIGSVRVEKLCEVVPFPGVWQMISTISCIIDGEKDSIDVIRNAFPMGSMTGAPKIRAMEIIEETENFRRGLFSGSIGYIDPSDNFDFNVVIRSLLYSTQSNILSFPAGSAITSDADAYQEYSECLLKASSIFKVITGKALSIP